MQVKASYRDIWNLSYPIIVGSVAQTIINFTDAAYLARVGETELGASALGGVFYFVLVMIGVAVAIGSQILIARRAGEKNYEAIGELFDQTLILMGSTALLLLVFVYGFAPYMFRALLQSGEVAEATIVFVKYRGWGLFFALIVMSFRSFYTGIATTRVLTYYSFVMMSANAVLGYLLIFGHAGFPEMGIAGAGLASGLSEVIAAAYLIVFTALKKNLGEFKLFRFRKVDVPLIIKILTLSSPVVLQHLLSMGSWFAFFVIIEQIGKHELAISNVVRSSYSILMTPIWGFSAASNTMVSNLIGQEKREDVLLLVRKIITLSMITSAILLFFSVVFAKSILMFIAADSSLVADSIFCFNLICIATLIMSASFVLINAVSGTGNTRASMVIEIINILVYVIYIYVFGIILRTNIEWVWLSEILYWFLMGAMSFWYLKSMKWKKISL